MSSDSSAVPSVIDSLIQRSGSPNSRPTVQDGNGNLSHSRHNRHKARALELPRDRLAIAFQKWRQAKGLSLADLSQVSAIDVAHIWRIEQGERPNTSREVLIVLSMAMVLDVATLDQVLEVANEILDAAGLKMLRSCWQLKSKTELTRKNNLMQK